MTEIIEMEQMTPEDVSPEECADVKRWLKRIEDARKFDEGARTGYAMDRKYARGDSGEFEVDVPIAQSYIDVLRSFLYARNPDVDARPAKATEPPPAAVIHDQAKQAIMSDPVHMRELAMAGPEQGQMLSMLIRQKAKELLEPFQRRRDDAKQLATTIEIIVSELWKRAMLKAQAMPQVTSGLTIGVGWLKAVWLERAGKDPVVQKQLDDVREQMERIAQLTEDMHESAGEDLDAQRADLDQQLQGLQANVDMVVARGFAVDFIAGEDIQVSSACRDMPSYLDAPWIAQRAFMTLEKAKVDYSRIDEDCWKQATIYHHEKPRDPTQKQDSGLVADVDARDAEAYCKSGGDGDGAVPEVCVWEVWNHDSSMVLTLIDGIDRYAIEPRAPDPQTTRFYPFFQFGVGAVDGERHFVSLVSRSARLFDEYNRVRTNYATHRRRAIPKTGFDASNLDKVEADKIANGDTGEMVPLKPLKPGTPISNLLQPIAYNRVDMGLYDTAVIRSELEMIWGIQEALSSSIHVAKTATEAEIQQSGTESRTGYMRDGLDDMLGELAQYTAEVALQKMDHEDVVAIAGDWAFWPEEASSDDLASLVTVDIKAGSSGKPDTAREQRAWSAVLPIIQNAISQVGQLRGSSPQDVADCIEELVSETLSRTGDRLDVTRFLPQAPDMGDAPPPAMAAQDAPPQGPEPPLSTNPPAQDAPPPEPQMTPPTEGAIPNA